MQKYEILGVIGEGAYGVVLRCRNTETKEIVAIKKFKESEQDASVKKTTMRQIKVLRMCNQANIVELKEAFRKKGIVCLVFQYVHNNLLEVLEKSPSGLEPQHIRSFMYQLMKGLAYMHSLNLIHRDIKPENLLISEKKVLKICDFGFARSVRRQDDNQQMTDYVATRWYRPPQLLVGARYGKEIDLWAVGCILGELVDGQPMFPGENELDQLFLIQKCLGPLTPDHHETFLKNPRFLGMKFPEISSLDTIEKRYFGKLSPKGISFIKALLRMEPMQRLTTIQALKHPYFDGIREEDFIRRIQSAQNSKTQHRVISASSHKQQPIQSKKSYGSPYNPIPYTDKPHEEQRYFNQTIYTSKNGRLQLKRKEDERESRLNNVKKDVSPAVNYQPLHSKSVNKNANIKRPKERNISQEKHRNKEALAKTQGGFFIQPVESVIHEQKKEEEDDGNVYARVNKIYGQKSSKIKESHGQIAFQQQSRPSKGIISTTEEVPEYEDYQNVFQSTGQLPFLVVGKGKDKNKGKDKGNINIVINQITYNYKGTHNYP